MSTTIEDLFGRAAKAAKWRAGQAVQLVGAQSQIVKLEGQIDSLKIQLADSTLRLYSEGRLSDELKDICASIVELQEKVQELKRQQEAVKNEQLPTETTSVSSSGLICPECKKPVPGRFCPEHGLEGIPTQ